MPEREFLTVEPADEFLPSTALPGWLRVLGSIVVAGLVVALVVPHLSGGSHKTAAAPHATRTRSPEPSPASALDVSISSIGTWVLDARKLENIGAQLRVIRSVPLSGPRFPAGSTPMLAVDIAAHRVWVAVANAAPSRMIEFDARTMRVIRDLTWGELIQDAVAYQGHLYLSTDLGVADLAAADRLPHYIPGLAGAVGRIALDAARHRLIAMDLGDPTDIWAFGPHRATFEAQAPLLLQRGTVAVVGGRIWVGGFTRRGAVLERLSPTTLQAVYRAPARRFGPGAVIVNGGAHVLWVRPGYESGPITCVSATTGRPEQSWYLPDVTAVASDANHALIATQGEPVEPILSGCAG